MSANPLLSASPQPLFSKIKPEHVVPAVETAIQRHAIAMAAIRASSIRDFAGVADIKELADQQLNWAWGPADHLEGVANSPALRAACRAARERLSAYRTSVAQDPELYDAIQAVAQGGEDLSAGRRRALDLAVRNLRLSGVALDAEKQARFAAIQVELGRLTSEFSNAVLDATESWTHLLESEAAVAGLPPAERALLRTAAEARGLDGWLATLHAPAVQAVMVYADDRDLRALVYRAMQTRASDQGPEAGRFDNSDRIAAILALRREAAQLLGFRSYAERSLVVKMAADVEAVMGLLTDLATRARPRAEAEWRELQDFAKSLGLDHVAPWDVAYLSEKLRRARHAVDQAELRRYFPLPKVLEGLFALIQALYGVTIVAETKVEVWNADVRYFSVIREGRVIAGFYLDAFARQGKRGGAWMRPARPRIADAPAIAYVNCNFPSPSDGEPSLLTHQDVITLFHEFGHCLHHVLSEAEPPSISGTAGFEWDAVEWPSQVMEGFAWEPAVLTRISAHVDTGAPLPEALIAGLRGARTFQSGLALLRQIELSLFDLRLHLVERPDRDTANRILTEVRKEIAIIQPPAWTRFAHTFTHVFAGGYAAGYYSYLWAEQLSADTFDALRGEAALGPGAGEDFRREVLAVGASRPAEASFVAFRGRRPAYEPLLHQRGLV